MQTVFVFAVVNILYGILGLFGIQNISEKFKGAAFEKHYRRMNAIGRLLLGISWLALWFATRNVVIVNKLTFCLVLIATALPALIFDIAVEIKFTKMLEKS